MYRHEPDVQSLKGLNAVFLGPEAGGEAGYDVLTTHADMRLLRVCLGQKWTSIVGGRCGGKRSSSMAM